MADVMKIAEAGRRGDDGGSKWEMSDDSGPAREPKRSPLTSPGGGVYDMPCFRSFPNVTAMSFMLIAALLGVRCSSNPETISLPEATVSDDVRAGFRRPSGVDLSLIDYSVSPGDDFYGFANGSWLAATSIPDEHDSYGFFTIADENLKRDLLSLMRSTERDRDAERLSEVVRALFSSGMDQAAIDSIGLSSLSPELDMIDSVRSLEDVPPVLARLQLVGVTPFFKIHCPAYWELLGTNHLYLRQTGLGIADGDVLGRGAGEQIVRHYRKFMIETLERLGETPPAASSLAARVIAMEQQLAALAMSESELRDFKRNYNLCSSRKLKQLIPGLDWTAFFAALDVKKCNKVVVGQPEYFREVGQIIGQQDWELIRAYLKWALLLECAPFLSSDFARSYEEFEAAIRGTRSPARSRDLVVADVVNREAPDAVGTLYLQEFFLETTRAKVSVIFNNLKVAFGRRLQRSTWLSEKTKTAALRKLIAMRLQMGGPEQTLSYDGVELAEGQFLRNVLKVREYRMRDFLGRIGEPLNPDDWDVPAQSASGWYRPYRNVVLLPAGSVNGLLRPEVDDAYNYGVFGTRLAHEMTHGFDQQGRLHDHNGQRKDWWSKSDVTAFVRKTGKLADYYGAFTVLDGEHLDGRRTLDENIADLGGLCIAFDAYLLSLGGVEPPMVDGFSGRQRFFLAYAQKWREVLSDFAMRFRLKGWHAPPQFRANGPVYHLPQFYEAFPEAGSGRLSLRRDERISIW